MFDQFAQLKENALQYIDEAAEFARALKQTALADQLETYKRELAETRYNIALVGNMNRGKSTLINTLLGRRDDLLSPVRSKVCTAAITHYLSRDAHPARFSEVKVFYHGDRKPESVAIEGLREYVTEDGNPNNSKGVRSVEVFGDFPLLHNVVTLVDTPGRGAIQQYHETLLEEFLPVADAIIFLISADLPIEASEREFLEMLSQEQRDRIFFVLTKRDLVDDGDIQTVRDFVQKQIRDAGLSCDQLFEVAAERVFEARKKGLPEEEIARIAQKSGISSLVEELERFIISKSQKNANLLPRIRTILESLKGFCEETRARVSKDLETQDTSIENLEEQLGCVKAEGEKLRKERDKAIRKFKENWSRETSRFKRAFTAKSDPISDRLIDRITRGNLLAVAGSAFKVGQFVSKAINQEMETLLSDLDRDLTNVVSRLNEDLCTSLETYQRVRIGTQVGMVGGTITTLCIPGIATAYAWSQVAAIPPLIGTFTAAAGTTGIPGFLAWLTGSGTVLQAGSALMCGVGAGIVAVGGALAAGWIASGLIKAIQENRVPALVQEAIEKATDEIIVKLDEQRDDIAKRYVAGVEEQIEANEASLAALLEARKSHDPKVIESLREQKAKIETLIDRNRDLNHSLALLPAPQT